MDETTKNSVTDWLISQHTSASNMPADLKMNAILIREYGDRAREIILAKRAERRVQDTLRQRKWQTNTSRRPARGRHHDSWSIREKYVRYAEAWPTFALASH